MEIIEDRHKSTKRRKHSQFGIIFSGLVLLAALIALPALNAQQSQTQQKQNDSMPGMHMGDSQKDPAATPQTETAANEDMSMKHMDMGPHMSMTALRPPNPADEKRAQEIVEQLAPRS
jgi:uncharacterized iron-regulated membrane protein